jgi:hypothetical protein
MSNDKYDSSFKILLFSNTSGFGLVHPMHPDVHTQSIEGLWMQIKRKLRYQSGTSRELFKSYIAEFQWRYSHKDNTFGQYLDLLSENYNI